MEKEERMKRMNRLATIAVVLMLIFFGSSVAAEDTVKIGAFFDLSGPASFIGTPTKLVADMVVDKINKEGGVNGQPIELIVGDTEGDPAKAANIAKKFIYKDKVAAIIGPTRTGTGMAVKKIIHAGKVPTFMTVGGDPVIMGGESWDRSTGCSNLPSDRRWPSSAFIRISKTRAWSKLPC
jgi:ABC-type branched-subunit amino acid transport system substrate-binding protein